MKSTLFISSWSIKAIDWGVGNSKSKCFNPLCWNKHSNYASPYVCLSVCLIVMVMVGVVVGQNPQSLPFQIMTKFLWNFRECLEMENWELTAMDRFGDP